MDVKWVKIRSWHAVKWSYSGTVIADPPVITRCGRRAVGIPVDELPTEKSCESCLRIVARLQDA